MKVLVIGATGTIGSAVVSALEASHQVVKASRTGPVRADLEDPPSLDALFREVPELDAVVCCAASGPLVDLESAADDEIAAAVRGKLLGQVALAQRAVRHLRDGGSITLTGGTFPAPLAGGSLGALVNTGLEGFVRNAADELPRRLRINPSALAGSRRPWNVWVRTGPTVLPSPRWPVRMWRPWKVPCTATPCACDRAGRESWVRGLKLPLRQLLPF